MVCPITKDYDEINKFKEEAIQKMEKLWRYDREKMREKFNKGSHDFAVIFDNDKQNTIFRHIRKDQTVNKIYPSVDYFENIYGNKASYNSPFQLAHIALSEEKLSQKNNILNSEKDNPQSIFHFPILSKINGKYIWLHDSTENANGIDSGFLDKLLIGSNGSFLIRPSSNHCGDYTLQIFVNYTMVAKKLIKYDSKLKVYTSGSRIHPSLGQFVEDYVMRGFSISHPNNGSRQYIIPLYPIPDLYQWLDIMKLKIENFSEEVELKDKRAAGNFGEVFLGVYKKKFVAVKRLKSDKGPVSLNSIYREFIIQS
ncbi:MAG: Tyrosine-protein kinase abl1, partial [Paramarteilia canceri]